MNRFEFKRIRKEILRVNQSELASALGVSSNTISRFEVGAMAICERTSFSMLYLEGLGVIPKPKKITPPSAKSAKSAKSKKSKRKYAPGIKLF